jgi:hypothetical protein
VGWHCSSAGAMPSMPRFESRQGRSRARRYAGEEAVAGAKY